MFIALTEEGGASYSIDRSYLPSFLIKLYPINYTVTWERGRGWVIPENKWTRSRSYVLAFSLSHVLPATLLH